MDIENWIMRLKFVPFKEYQYSKIKVYNNGNVTCIGELKSARADGKTLKTLDLGGRISKRC